MTADRIPPDRIDGGFEFNRLYLYDPSDTDANAKLRKRRGMYVVAFGSIPGYSIAREYTYQHWFPWHVQKIVVLRKQS